MSTGNLVIINSLYNFFIQIYGYISLLLLLLLLLVLLLLLLVLLLLLLFIYTHM